MVENDPSPGREVAKFIAENIEQIATLGSRLYRVSDAKIRSKLIRTFDNYATEFWKKYSRGRSFFVREESDVYSFYVHLPIFRGSPCDRPLTENQIQKNQNNRIVAPSIKDIFSKRNNAIVTGTGGSGKSMLVRHLVLDCAISGFGVPVFIELKNLPDLTFPTSLSELVISTLATLDIDLRQELLQESIKVGHLVIIIDGFDELPETQQHKASQEIQKFASQFPNTRVLVTSRPDELFGAWHGFEHFAMAPLNLEEAVDFVERQNYDNELSAQFKSELQKGGFVKHQSFLSNPLLLTIMMLTYGQSGSIPEKLGEFYQNAFEALFQRHDVLKGGYTRPRLCTLDFTDFGRVFSAFCIHSYSDRCVSFDAEHANMYVARAKETTQIDFSGKDFIRDSVKAVCLLAEEGLKKVFAHRSFQEYFAAKFIANCEENIAVQLLIAAEPRLGQDRLHYLTHELNPTLFESKYLGPRTQQIKNELKIRGRVTIDCFLRYIKRNYDSITIEDGRMLWSCTVGNGKDFRDHRLCILASRLGLTGKYKSAEALAKKYQQNELVEFHTEELKRSDLFVEDLYNSGTFCSKKSLEDFFNMGETLIKKGQQRETSLAAVLAGFGKGPR